MTQPLEINDILFGIIESSHKKSSIYERQAEFFRNPSKYVSYEEQMEIHSVTPGYIQQLSLECSGHGSFKKNLVAERFIKHLYDIIRFNPKIKKIKLRISGFNLKLNLNLPFMQNQASQRSRKSNKIHLSNQQQQQVSPMINAITSLIKEQVIQHLTSLEIRITNVTNCSMKDFQAVMQTGVNHDAKQLTNLVCEFSDWTFPMTEKDAESDLIYQLNEKVFKKNDHDRNGQPRMMQFLDMLDTAFSFPSPMLELKDFRLEISTWFYSDVQFEKFFSKSHYSGDIGKKIQMQPHRDANNAYGQRVSFFHKQFRTKIQTLISVIMPCLTHMQIDLRNWHKRFEMGTFKSMIGNINNSNKKNSLSQVSGKLQKKKANQIFKSIIEIALLKQVEMNSQSANSKKVNQQLKEMLHEPDNEEFFDLIVVV